MTALRRRMDEDMVVRGMADRTRETYMSAGSRGTGAALPSVARPDLGSGSASLLAASPA